MSKYLNDFDFDALMAPNQEPFDFNFLDYPVPIGQNEAAGDDYNATYGFEPGMDFGAGPALDFDFNADFQPGPSLPLPPDATTMTDQSGVKPPSPPKPGLISIAPVTSNNGIGKYVCEDCHQLFDEEYLLWHHKYYKGNAIKLCSLSGCNSRFYSCIDLHNHRRTPHLPGHCEVWDDSAITCAECNGTFDSVTELLRHAKRQKHSPYACSCRVKFARHDVLIRHLEGFTKEGAKYQCTFCRRHRGKQAFRRRDHLVQHLQGYHKMEPEEIDDAVPSSRSSAKSRQTLTCPHADCEAYRDDAFKTLPWTEQFEGRPFQKQSDYNKHMRDVHKESAFSCPISSCERVGPKGYMREKDLMKHLADKHPEAPVYSCLPPEPREYRCRMCSKGLTTVEYIQEHESRTCPKLKTNDPSTAWSLPLK